MEIEKILKENNKNITTERIDIFLFIKTMHIFSSKDILENFKNLWRASVFRTIKLFQEIWIIRRVWIWDKIEMYEILEEKHHHEHMKCEKCWDIISFESKNLCNMIFKEAINIWFSIKEHSIQILWKCKKCNT